MMKKRNITSRLNKVDYLIFSFCSIFAVASLFLFYKDMNSFSIKQDEEPIATISFKENTVQRKLDNRNIWEKVNLACEIYNGDSLRTSSESKVIAAFLENDVKINLDENSMIQLFKNKKKDFIDFIGGEIHIENTSSDAPIIIHAGTKAISIMANSKAKLTAVESDNADEKPTEAIIEVESGEVEVTEIQETKKKVVEEEKVTVTAGNVLEISLEKELPVEPKEEIVEPKEEIVAEEEIVVEEETEIIEETVETPVEEIEIAVEEKMPAVEEINEKFTAPVFTEVKENAVAERSEPGIAFIKIEWDGGHNHGYGIKFSDLFGINQMIKKGSSLKLKMSGTSNKDITNLAFQLSTGELDWYDSVNKNVVLNSVGIKANEKFEYETILYIGSDIVNTNEAIFNLCYEPNVLDESAYIKDFALTVELVKNKPKSLPKNYVNEVSYDNVGTGYSSYVNEEGKEILNGKFCFEPSDIFGHFISIEKGTKIKFTIEGDLTTKRKISWMAPEFVQNLSNNWKNCVESINFVENDEISSSKKISYTKTLTFTDNVDSTDACVLNMVYSFPNDKKPNVEPASIKNCKIKVEVIE